MVASVFCQVRHMHVFCKILAGSVRTPSSYLFSSDPTRPDEDIQRGALGLP
jgi:hypothetical protein